MPRKHKCVYLSDLLHEPAAKGPAEVEWTTRTPAPVDVGEVWPALDSLAPVEGEVIRHRYGLDGGEPQTLDEIGRALGRTRERVRQIERKALDKLKKRLAKS
jgi:RNA polymerase primary sigma factor